MQDEVAKLLLNGIPFHQFIAFFIAGGVGAILSFGINVGQGVKKNTATPTKFRWSFFKIKIWRVVTAVISLAAAIVFNKEVLGFLLASEAVIELTVYSSFVLGMGADQLGKKFTSIKK